MPTPPFGAAPAAGHAPTVTPAMRQYLDAKQQYRDAILFFRMGDFYEMFYEDALVAARALDLTLTSRSRDSQGTSIPMCGVPHHAADTYLARLVKKGYRVAICDQVEDPKKAKGIVKREIVRVVSPGTLTESQHLDERSPAFLLALTKYEKTGSDPMSVGVALLDLTTGEFSCAEYTGPAGLQALADEVMVLRPREIVAPVDLDLSHVLLDGAGDRLPVTRVEPWTFEHESARRTLLDQFRTNGLEGFGLDGHPFAVSAAGALLHYLRDTQKADLAHVRSISYKTSADCLLIDAVTLKHLEIVESMEGGREGSLLHEIDRTVTADGRTPAARVAAAAAGLARSHPRPPGCRRGVRLPQHRPRQVSRGLEERAGSRAPRRACRARQCGAARSRRPEAVDCRRAARAAHARGVRGAAHPIARQLARRPHRRARRHRPQPHRRARARSCATAAISATASTRSSTTCAASADRANR